MRFFDRNIARKSRAGSHLALAIALATGAAVGVTSFAEPAYAQKKKKKGDEVKAQYSDEFRAAYIPVDEATKADTPDHNAVAAMLPALVAASNSPHEKLATGTAVYNTGVGMKSDDLRLQGLELMLGSGLTTPEQNAQFNAIAFELTYRAKQYDKAAYYADQAIKAGFDGENFSADDMRFERARVFIMDEKPQEAVQYLSSLIAEKRASGTVVPENWYRLATTQAYELEMTPQVYDLMHGWVVDYPSKESWQSSIAMVRNINNYSGAETLDAMRLGFLVNSLLNSGDYLDLVEAVSPRRRPLEVKTIITEGIKRGMIDASDPFASEQLGLAEEQIKLDKSELPPLERDAFKPGAPLRTVVGAADTLLSYGMGDKAAQLYKIALDLPGVDRSEALTRMGMAQIVAGDYNGAKQTLASVQGPRYGIANLWAAYAERMAAEVPQPAASAEAAATS